MSRNAERQMQMAGLDCATRAWAYYAGHAFVGGLGGAVGHGLGALATGGSLGFDDFLAATVNGAMGGVASFRGMRVCFTGRMPMRTPTGHVLAADVRRGLMLNSRDEFDPDGRVVARTVEEVFERFGPVWLLRANGRDVETTPEHPFFVAGQGWTPLNRVRAGDVVRLEDGWATVEAVEDTGSWQTVYNFRIADDHTYFVGCDEWGFAVWAHNRYGDLEQVLPNVPVWRLKQAYGRAVHGTFDDFIGALGEHAPSGIRQQRVAYMAARLRDGAVTGRAELVWLAEELGMTNGMRHNAQQALARLGLIDPTTRGRGGDHETRATLDALDRRFGGPTVTIARDTVTFPLADGRFSKVASNRVADRVYTDTATGEILIAQSGRREAGVAAAREIDAFGDILTSPRFAEMSRQSPKVTLLLVEAGPQGPVHYFTNAEIMGRLDPHNNFYQYGSKYHAQGAELRSWLDMLR